MYNIHIFHFSARVLSVFNALTYNLKTKCVLLMLMLNGTVFSEKPQFTPQIEPHHQMTGERECVTRKEKKNDKMNTLKNEKKSEGNEVNCGRQAVIM